MTSLVKACREAAGLTMSEVARRSGLSISKLSKIEHGTHRLKVDDVPRLADAIGCDVRALIPKLDPALKRRHARLKRQKESDAHTATQGLRRRRRPNGAGARPAVPGPSEHLRRGRDDLSVIGEGAAPGADASDDAALQRRRGRRAAARASHPPQLKQGGRKETQHTAEKAPSTSAAGA